MRLDLVEWTSANYTPLSSTDIEENIRYIKKMYYLRNFQTQIQIQIQDISTKKGTTKYIMLITEQDVKEITLK